ncbi:MAG TPA: trypsin-like serine protease, partial [Polyangiales bacterium]|nr:trypsin-like serine protease [Polyangiales bacterium]
MGTNGRFFWTAIAVVVGATGLLACSEPEPADSAPWDSPPSDSAAFDSPLGVVASAVVGGEMVNACQWPSAIHVNSCSATLIHPRVVVTAAHCLSGTTGRVLFGNSSSAPGAFTLTGACRAGARGSAGGGTRNDWGYCVIPEDDRVKKIPITPPLVGCEAEKFLKAGATAWVVGYGSTGSNNAGQGVKRQVAVMVNRVTNGIVDVGDRDHGACHGDSGGPLYMQVGDDTHNWGWRV